MRLLQGELKPTAGKIFYHQHCQRGYFGQTNIERLDPDNTIVSELATVNPELKDVAIRNTAGAMMFGGDTALKKISVLSGGEKSRVSLGKILLTPTNILLLDEPTNHLDSESCDSLIAALDDFEGAQVIVTHNELFLHHLVNRLIVFKDDKVSLFDGSYQDFLDKVGWEEEPAPKKNKEQKKPAPQKSNNHKQTQLLKQIGDIEKAIQELEKKQHELSHTLTTAINQSNTTQIKTLQIQSHDLNKEMNKHYEQMETLIAELDDV